MDVDVLFAAKVVWPKMPYRGFKISSKNTYQTYLYHNHIGIKISLNCGLLMSRGFFQLFESKKVLD